MPPSIGYNAYTPEEVIEMVSRIGVKKGNMEPYKIFLSAVSAGALLSFAGATSLSTNTSPWFQENAPGLIRMIGALVFPYGLVMIVLTGADLCTGTFMYTTVAVLHRRLSIPKMLIHWVLCFFGNLAGALFMVAVIFGYGGVFDASPYREEAIAFATKKQIVPAWHMIFLRAIGCNWLVCLGCFFGIQGRELVSKVAGIWWPIFGFVSLGLDHVVANMFFIPMGIWLGTPNLTIPLYIWKGLIPAGLGNIIGGAIFCGGYYWFMFLLHQDPIAIDGIRYGQMDHVQAINGRTIGNPFPKENGDLEKGANANDDENDFHTVRGPGSSNIIVDGPGVLVDNGVHTVRVSRSQHYLTNGNGHFANGVGGDAGLAH